MAMFLVVAGGVAVASLQVSSSLKRSQAQVGVAAAIDTRLDVLGSYRYEELVGDSFTAPDMCGPLGAERAASCINVDGVDIRVEYAITTVAPTVTGGVSPAVSSAAVEVVATATLPDGTTTSRVRQIVPPTVGYTGQEAVLRVRQTTNTEMPPNTTLPPLVLLDATNNVVVPNITFTDSLSLVKVPGDACTGDKAPCRLGLSPNPGSWWEAGDYTMALPDILGPANRFRLAPGGFAETLVAVNQKGSTTLRIRAERPGGATAEGAEPGSVCLWGTVDAGGVTRSMPYCNTGDGSSITISSFYDPTTAKTYPLTTGAAVRLTVDNPDGSCPSAGAAPFPRNEDGTALAPLGNVNGNWVLADVCTSWTWGVPAQLQTASKTEPYVPKAGVSVTVTSTNDVADLVWKEFTSANGVQVAAGRPAAGDGTLAPWSKPRDATLIPVAPGCATDGNPETTCPSMEAANIEADDPSCGGDPFCKSTVNMPPVLTSPGNARSLPLTGPTTPITLVVDDPDSSSVEIVFDPNNPTPTGDRLPLYGTLKLASTDAAIGLPDNDGIVQTVFPVDAQGRLQLSYTKGGGYENLDDFTFTVRDGDGNIEQHTVTLYSLAVPHRISANALNFSQGSENATFTVTVTDTSGGAANGTTVSLTSSGGLFQLAPSSGDSGTEASTTTGADGKATFTVNVGATPSGTYAFLATVDQAGLPAPVQLTIPVTVKPAAGAITITTASGASQGGVGQFVTEALDRANEPFAGVLVELSVTRNGGPTTMVRPESGTCTTDAAGRCAMPLLVAADASTGQYTVVARSGSFTSSSNITITPAVARITAGTDGSGAVGTYQALVAGSGASGHWPLDERGGTTVTDIRGGVSATVYGTVGYGQPALAGTGTSMRFDGSSRICTSSETRTGPTTFEAWVLPEAFKPTSPTTSHVFGTSDTTLGRARLVFGGAGATGGDVPGFSFEAGGSTYALKGRSVPVGTTHHLVAVVGDTMAMLYVNGRLVDSVSFSGQFSFSGSLCGAGFGNNTGAYLTGTLDELAMYPHALSAATIRRLSSSGRTDAGSVAGATVVMTQGSTASVRVRVLDGAGASMPGVVVEVVNPSEDSGLVVSTSSRDQQNRPVTGSDGQLTFTLSGADIQAGTYGPVLFTAGGATVPVTVEVSQVVAGLNAPESITVPQGGRVDIPVTVVDVEGRPVNGVGVQARFESNGMTKTPPGLGFSRSATSLRAPDGTDGIAPFTVTAGARLTPSGSVGQGGAVASYGIRLFIPDPSNPQSSIPLASRYVVVNVSADISAVETDPNAVIPQGGSTQYRVKLVGGGQGQPVSVTCVGTCGLTFNRAVEYTNGNGVATFTAIDSDGPNPAGTVNVTITVAGRDYPRTVTVVSPPDAPSMSATQPVNGSTTLNIMPSGNNGGAPVVDYEVQISTFDDFRNGGTTTTRTTSLTYQASGLTANPVYYFRVRARNVVGTGPWSSPTEVQVYSQPSAPTNVTAVRQASQTVRVSWVAPTGGSSVVTDYDIRYATNSTMTSTTFFEGGTITSTSIDVTGLTNGTTYWFQVRASNSAGDSPWSATSNSAVPVTTPGAPFIGSATLLAATGSSPASVSVAFLAPSSNGGAPVLNYTVTSNPGGLTATCVTSPCTVTNLQPGTPYTFTVRAANVIGVGPWSSVSNSVTVPNVPNAPSGLTFTNLTSGSGGAVVTFVAPTSTGGAPVFDYDVEYSTTPGFAGGTGTLVNGGVSTSLTQAVTGLTSGVTYYFRVRATNSGGPGSWSAASTGFTPISAPSTPVVANCQSTYGTTTTVPNCFRITWADVAGETGYTLTRSLVSNGAVDRTVTLPAGTTEFTDAAVWSGTQYTYRIKATNASGQRESSASSTISYAAATFSYRAPCNGSGSWTPQGTSTGIALVAALESGSETACQYAGDTTGNRNGWAAAGSPLDTATAVLSTNTALAVTFAQSSAQSADNTYRTVAGVGSNSNSSNTFNIGIFNSSTFGPSVRFCAYFYGTSATRCVDSGNLSLNSLGGNTDPYMAYARYIKGTGLHVFLVNIRTGQSATASIANTNTVAVDTYNSALTYGLLGVGGQRTGMSTFTNRFQGTVQDLELWGTVPT